MRVACVQMSAGEDFDAACRDATQLACEGAEKGAKLLAFPENAIFMPSGVKALRAHASPEKSHPGLKFFLTLSKELERWILLGSLAIRLAEKQIVNRSFLINSQGQIVARYDKIHLFEARLGNGEVFRESNSYRAGERAVIVDTPWGIFGLTICYDLRFPHLYRDLAKSGAKIITVPSAFTRSTGEAHWHALLRARAIETGAFVVAPAQTGSHPGGRKTFGHSLVVAPWGEILGDAGKGVCLVIVDMDLEQVDLARAAIPSLEHDRVYSSPNC